MTLFTLIQNIQIQKYINLVDMAMYTDDKRKLSWQDTNRIERSCQSRLSISKNKNFHFHIQSLSPPSLAKFSDKWKNN